MGSSCETSISSVHFHTNVVIYCLTLSLYLKYYSFCLETMCGYYEKKLLSDLIVDYNALERPGNILLFSIIRVSLVQRLNGKKTQGMMAVAILLKKV